MRFKKRAPFRKKKHITRNIERPFLTRKKDKVIFPNPHYAAPYTSPVIVAQPEPPPIEPEMEADIYEKYDSLRMADKAADQLEESIIELEKKGKATAEEVAVINQRIDEWIEELKNLEDRLIKDNVPLDELLRVKAEVDDLIAKFNGVKNRLIHSGIKVKSRLL